MKDGNIFVENVPFSCCDVTSLRPCVTTNVMDFLSRKNYDKVTLYKMGCSTKLMDEFENEILQPVGSFVLALYFTQVCPICFKVHVALSECFFTKIKPFCDYLVFSLGQNIASSTNEIGMILESVNAKSARDLLWND